AWKIGATSFENVTGFAASAARTGTAIASAAPIENIVRNMRAIQLSLSILQDEDGKNVVLHMMRLTRQFFNRLRYFFQHSRAQRGRDIRRQPPFGLPAPRRVP